MATVSILTQPQADDVDRAALEAGVAGYGQVLNTWGAILNSPGLFAAYLPFLKQVNGPGALPERIKDLAAIRVGVLNHCKYTVSHRCTSALNRGISLDEVVAAASGAADAFLDEREQVALALAAQVTVALPQATREESATGVSDDLFGRATELFGDQEFVELLMSISMWNALSRFHRVMDFDLDMPQAPEQVEALL